MPPEVSKQCMQNVECRALSVRGFIFTSLRLKRPYPPICCSHIAFFGGQTKHQFSAMLPLPFRIVTYTGLWREETSSTRGVLLPLAFMVLHKTTS